MTQQQNEYDHQLDTGSKKGDKFKGNAWNKFGMKSPKRVLELKIILVSGRGKNTVDSNDRAPVTDWQGAVSLQSIAFALPKFEIQSGDQISFESSVACMFKDFIQKSHDFSSNVFRRLSKRDQLVSLDLFSLWSEQFHSMYSAN